MLKCLQFHLETAKKRAQQRMREGRAKPIDALAINLFLMEEFDVNMTAPYSVFIGLALDEVEELCDDIKGYQVREEGLHASSICTASEKVQSGVGLPGWLVQSRALKVSGWQKGGGCGHMQQCLSCIPSLMGCLQCRQIQRHLRVQHEWGCACVISVDCSCASGHKTCLSKADRHAQCKPVWVLISGY